MENVDNVKSANPTFSAFEDASSFGVSGGTQRTPAGSRYDINNTPVITEIYVDGNTQYVCEAPIGSALADSVWRISKISKNLTGGDSIRWTNGGLPGVPATDLTTVKNYTYS